MIVLAKLLPNLGISIHQKTSRVPRTRSSRAVVVSNGIQTNNRRLVVIPKMESTQCISAYIFANYPRPRIHKMESTHSEVEIVACISNHLIVQHNIPRRFSVVWMNCPPISEKNTVLVNRQDKISENQIIGCAAHFYINKWAIYGAKTWKCTTVKHQKAVVIDPQNGTFSIAAHRRS